MFDPQEIAQRALLRADIIKKERAAQKRKIYAAASVAACLAFIVGLSLFLPPMPDGIVTQAPNAASATLLAGAGIGGYALMGIIGFVLGVAVTLFYVKKLKKD